MEDSQGNTIFSPSIWREIQSEREKRLLHIARKFLRLRVYWKNDVQNLSLRIPSEHVLRNEVSVRKVLFNRGRFFGANELNRNACQLVWFLYRGEIKNLITYFHMGPPTIEEAELLHIAKSLRSRHWTPSRRFALKYIVLLFLIEYYERGMELLHCVKRDRSHCFSLLWKVLPDPYIKKEEFLEWMPADNYQHIVSKYGAEFSDMAEGPAEPRSLRHLSRCAFRSRLKKAKYLKTIPLARKLKRYLMLMD